MIGLLDAGTGNLGSFRNALDYLDIKYTNINKKEKISDCDKIILPGVGSFRTLMNNLLERDLKEGVINFIKEEKPFLGICVGMQVLSDFGNEFKKTKGLGWINGTVNLLKSQNLPLPHVGWNNIELKIENSLTSGLRDNKDFYFVHSFCFEAFKSENIIATTFYGNDFTSIINKDNIYGFQFHPEKSQRAGQLILKNFIK